MEARRQAPAARAHPRSRRRSGVRLPAGQEAQRGRARPGDPPDPSIAGAGPPGHRGPRRRALRRGHRQQRRRRSCVALRCASGTSCRARRAIWKRPWAALFVARLAGDKPRLEVLGSDRPAATFPVADGQQALSFWGDLVAVAADSAVVLYEVEGDSDGDRDRVAIPVSGTREGGHVLAFGPPDLRRARHRGTARPRPLERPGADGHPVARSRHRPERRPLRSVDPGPARPRGTRPGWWTWARAGTSAP